MKTCLLVLLVTGAWWLCITIVVMEETRAEHNSRKEGTSSEIPAKSPRPVEGRLKKPLPARTQTVQSPESEIKALSSLKATKTIPGKFGNAGQKPHRATKTSKKMPRKAVVAQPRIDLMHYGVLEDPQRYDPRPHAHAAGVPNPQTPDLTHDHFQELDRNQDGKIDPVERAFGRIDMDRDLNTRTFK
ncbi:MAG: hypothetical protein K0S79_413 [Nitrospira sp.]|jgi:hypothetical protein|nr:hypothetical protein [Nitrospira sp.]